jgi:hypothetical protein
VMDWPSGMETRRHDIGLILEYKEIGGKMQGVFGERGETLGLIPPEYF